MSEYKKNKMFDGVPVTARLFNALMYDFNASTWDEVRRVLDGDDPYRTMIRTPNCGRKTAEEFVDIIGPRPTPARTRMERAIKDFVEALIEELKR